MHQEQIEKEINKILTENKLINSENSLIRVPYERELQFMNNIKNGNYTNIHFANFEELKINTGKSASESKLWEYYTAATISSCTRAAIEGGMNPNDAFDISDAMLELLEKSKKAEEMHALIIQTATILSYSVYKTKSQNGHYLIEQTKRYISRNIFSRIYLKDIALELNINASYLSRFFSEQEQIPLHDYIMHEKMKIACNMLKYSDRSISEISQYLSISSQSNFTENFKKWIGTTPQKYRTQNQSENFYSFPNKK